ncbi:SDR family oxidoreductase [uncultured Bifidobacterium sp.]|uniref:SDR family oxidoreductase n=1 Tax=uncultured Bifidobacterium sp. TaxID=165187 RepID=UPI0025F97268|nr:SDR family oxidoreductase [uncultured Bifidobacterium sp.]
MTDRLRGKVAIITGGTGGIGMGIAECYVREGAKVALTDIKESDASRSFTQKHPEQVVFHTLDVTDEDQWVSAIDTVEKELGQLTTVVNNAGIGGSGATMDEETYEDWKKVIAINLNGTFLGTKHGMRVMKGRGGSIINISSIEGFVGLSRAGAYNASKGGTRLLTKSAALDSANNGYGVRINSVHPGFIKTPLISQSLEDRMSKLTPLGHIGEPQDIGEICVYLASDESKFALGAEFVVDGGFIAQ